MAKLLSENYFELVKQAFYYPQTDIENYYLNQLNKYHEENSNFIQGILDALSRWEDTFFQGIPFPYTWEEDEHGNKKFPSKDSASVPLLPHLGITGHIKMDFFKMHKEIIGRIGELIILTKEVMEIESLFTKEQLVYLNSRATFPKIYDIELLTRRLKAHEEIPNDKGILQVAKQNLAVNFEALFKTKYKNAIPDFIAMLYARESTVDTNDGRGTIDLPALINVNNEWIGNKQAARVYYETLLDKGVVKQVARITYANIFKNTFHIPSISFISQKPGNKAEDYRPYFIEEIDEIVKNITPL